MNFGKIRVKKIEGQNGRFVKTSGLSLGILPAVKLSVVRNPGLLDERCTVERREALGIAKCGLRLDDHDTAGLNK